MFSAPATSTEGHCILQTTKPPFANCSDKYLALRFFGTLTDPGAQKSHGSTLVAGADVTAEMRIVERRRSANLRGSTERNPTERKARLTVGAGRNESSTDPGRKTRMGEEQKNSSRATTKTAQAETMRSETLPNIPIFSPFSETGYYSQFFFYTSQN